MSRTEGSTTSVFLALKLEPTALFLEGEAGVGKTEIAKVLTELLDTRAHSAAVLRGPRRQPGGLRVELYPSDDAHPVWPRAAARSSRRRDLFGPEFLLKSPAPPSDRRVRRPERTRLSSSMRWTEATRSSRRSLLEASLRLSSDDPRDRNDSRRPRNARSSSSRRTEPARCTTRSRRRCLYFWIDYPDVSEGARDRAGEAATTPPSELSSQVTRFVQELRQMELYKVPGRRGDARLG